MAAILFLPSESRTGHFLTSQDRFKIKKSNKKYFIHAKTVYASGPFESWTGQSGFQMVGHLVFTICKPDRTVWISNGRPSCFYHLKAKLFCPILQYLSGFQMAKTKWPLPFESRTRLFFSASLDRFIQKIFLFMTLFY
jgi:hypothetical protein